MGNFRQFSSLDTSWFRNVVVCRVASFVFVRVLRTVESYNAILELPKFPSVAACSAADDNQLISVHRPLHSMPITQQLRTHSGGRRLSLLRPLHPASYSVQSFKTPNKTAGTPYYIESKIFPTLLQFE
jgi:hypothetical protein